MNRYQILNACGEGFYGTVFKSRHKQSDTLVAIKQFKGKEDYATKREIETLSKLKHPNIINLREVFREQGKLHMVFEFLDTDLLNALGKYPKGMPERLVRIYMSQLCKALDYCHQRGVVHRDLKPENLLVTGDVQNPDPKRSLKLCDFGEARDIAPGDKFLSGIIGTRWYRAPEILVGAKVAAVSKSNDASSFNKVTRPKLLRYDFQVDMWGAGCIMGELLLASPMFPADTDLQQLEMVQVYGTPQQLTRRFKGKCSAVCESGLKGLLELSPHKRLTAKSALLHQFFGRRGSGSGGGGGGSSSHKNSFADSHSAAHSRAKFKQSASTRGMGGLDEIDEEIDTESDSDFEEEAVGMPEDDDHSLDDYYGDDLEQPEQPEQPHVNEVDDDDADVGYSDDEFEEGYSDEEFEEPVEELGAEEKVPEAAEAAAAAEQEDKTPDKTASKANTKSRKKQASALLQDTSPSVEQGTKNADAKKASASSAAKGGAKAKPSSGKATMSKPPRGQSVAKTSNSTAAGGGAVAGSAARTKLDSRASVRSKPGSRASVRSKPGSRASVRSTNSKSSTGRGSGRASSRGSSRRGSQKGKSAAPDPKSKSKKAVSSSNKKGSATKTAKKPDKEAGAGGSTKKKKATTEKVPPPASSRSNNASASGDRAASKKRQKASGLKTKKAAATDPVGSKKKLKKKKAKVL